MSTIRPLSDARLPILAVAATLVLCMPIVAMAQTQAPAPTVAMPTAAAAKTHTSGGAAEERNEMRTKRLQKLTQELGLTNDQAAKVKAIFEAKSAEMSDLRAKYEGQPSTPENKAAMEKSHKALHAEIEAKLAQVLTAEQMTKYKQMRAEHMRKEGSKEEKAEAKEGSK